jgi:DnaK suppressor protein
MLTKEEREALENLLHWQIEDVRDDIESLEEAVQPISPDNAIGRVSRMDAISSKSVNEELLRQSRQRLVQLEAALLRIREEAFGRCFRCGGAIPYGRLAVLPESTQCADCASGQMKR